MGLERRSAHRFEGQVEDVRNEKVLVRFDGKFHAKHITGMKYDVRFTVRKGPEMLRRLAIADALQYLPQSILFPVPMQTSLASHPLLPTPTPYNRNLNSEQLQAVRDAMSGCEERKGMPFIIFGPPGGFTAGRGVHATYQRDRSRLSNLTFGSGGVYVHQELESRAP